ncbi:uncharacterized protein SCHCODRAFT_02695521 [Schizophyllum commune H4-8]|uniref:J domain-containing protein n=1 Tax=Schizophyllum commune (strain H4-8 / FGSC 9210) TaxID=578458 RepID=D8PVN3_SCHCM|nr:uncharacterized protein SCHCODRAFT_02695521 [Schizophyllum commune H4-8]KAI5900281.1 hypothetical protein SCHCODRAFT_02695521 [Schizophyllum commune H4-8]
MRVKHSTVLEAYQKLGLNEGDSLETVKTKYKQVALRTHPDKNPDNPDATALFQEVSEAYSVLLKHLDTSAPQSRHYHPYGYDDDDGDDEYDSEEYDEYDYYSDYDDDYYSDDDEMEFFMYLFEELMQNRASRFAHAHFHHANMYKPPAETPQEFQARISKQREEQIIAEERRQREAAARKARAEQEREAERAAAEQRQKAKVQSKKAQAQAQRTKGENAARVQKQKVQATRSAAFAAARSGDAEAVKKAVWEDSVDPTGGEVQSGCEEFVEILPADGQETLLHIAVKRGDMELVKWLDEHSADAEERNSSGHTAFHIALQHGHVSVATYFLDTYPPSEEDHEGVYSVPDGARRPLLLAVDANEPELAYLLLEKKLANADDAREALAYARSDAGRAVILGLPTKSGGHGKAKSKGQTNATAQEKYGDMLELLVRYGGAAKAPDFAEVDEEKDAGEDSESASGSNLGSTPSAANASQSSGRPSPPNARNGHSSHSNGHSNKRPPRARPNGSANSQSWRSPATDDTSRPSSQQSSYRGRGNGKPRGRGRGRGRATGRGGRGHAYV